MTMLGKIKRKLRTSLLGYEVSTYFFSQSGEDQILYSIFANKFRNNQKGFYVDVGAYHPHHHSNTFMFYLAGWQGINIDACPGTKALFDKKRPRDINLELGVGLQSSTLTYYYINAGSTMNSFSKENLERIGMLKEVTREIPVQVKPLRTILDENLPADITHIDFLSIDVEGLELDVLKSHDWDKYQISAICVESPIKFLDELSEVPTHKYLSEMGYKPVAKTVLSNQTSSLIYISPDLSI